MTGNTSSDTLHLAEWLEEQKQRANDRIADDRVGGEETLRWKGERDLIDSIQSYLEMGVLTTETLDGDTEHVRYENQGAEFRVVSRDTSGLEAVYLEKKRSCDDDWQHERKLGWRARDGESNAE